VHFVDPVIDRDFPDPGTLRVGDTYYAYATNVEGTNVQVARSTDLVRWALLPDALPALPGWAHPGFTWAPEVTTTANGRSYVLYFAARDRDSGRQAIGAATSRTPEGPFTPAGGRPFICQDGQGGAIDPSTFVDDHGARYLLWKNDGNACGLDTWIYLQQVSGDGLTLEGAPVRLLRGDLAWEGSLVEAPTLWRRGGRYYLFYSANEYATKRYAVGYAVAEAPWGPYRKAGEPLLATSTEHGPVIGPGGQDIAVGPDGRTWLLYHAWDPRTVAYRSLHLDELVWERHGPRVHGPHRIPQLAPC
jgi:beta-xylosidase